MRVARLLSIVAVWFLVMSCGNETTGPEPSPNPEPENVWKLVYSAETTASGWEMGGLWFNGPNDGWAAYDTTIIRWDGSSWRKWADLKEVYGTAVGISDICALSEDCVWLTARFPVDAYNLKFYVVYYDGSRWHRFDLLEFPEWLQRMTDIYFLAPDDGWLYVSDGFYHYDGEEWKLVYKPAGTSHGNFAFARPDLGWALASLGQGYVLLRWNGTTWTPEDVPPANANVSVRHVWACGPDNAWATGVDYTGKEHGLLYYFDGSSWEKVPIKGMPYLYCAFSDASSGWLVSEYWAWLYRNNRLTCYGFTDSPRAYSSRDVWALGRDNAWIYAYGYGSGEVAIFHFEGLS